MTCLTPEAAAPTELAAVVAASSSPQTTGRRRQGAPPRAATLAGLLCAVAVVVAAVRIGRQTPAFQDWDYARRSLASLVAEQQRVGSSGSMNPRLLYYIGLRLNEKQRYAEADGCLRQAVGLDPDSPRLRDEWARALLGSGQIQAAFGELQEFAGTHQDSADAHFILGKFYFVQQSMKRASEEFKQTVTLVPSRADAWAYLSQADSSLGRRADALQEARVAVDLAPREARSRLLLAYTLAGSASPEAVRAQFQQAVLLGPGMAIAHEKYAEWLLTVSGPGDGALAVAEATRAVTLDANDAAAQLTMGRALLADSRAADAVGPLKRAAELDRDDSAAPQALSVAYAKTGDGAESRTWRREYVRRQDYRAHRHTLQEAVVVSPDDPGPKVRLAHFLAMHGEVEEAAHHYAMARHCATDAPRVLVETARGLLEGGHGELALPLARRAVEAAPHSPEAIEVCGDALLMMGSYKQAIEQYNTVLVYLPERLPFLQARLEKAAAAHPEWGVTVAQIHRNAVKPAAAP